MGGQHTPGPWVQHPRFPAYIIPHEHAQRPVGAACDPARDLATYAQEICSVIVEGRHRGKAETEANARLIAAAPELLEVCKVALATHTLSESEPGLPSIPEVGAMLKEAIAKATGAPA